MKAWRVEKHGGLDALKLLEVPAPEPSSGEARVRVQAVGLNHMDLWVRKGVPGYQFPLPMTPGCDCAGVVEKFGPLSETLVAELASDGIAPGRSVVIQPTLSCGRCEACLNGSDPLCRRFGILGETRDGACAESIVVPVQNLIALPAEISPTEACSIGVPFVTAWTMLVDKARLMPGEVVLIHAGGSGVSVAAIQIAKLMGATVIATLGSEEKSARAQALGVDHVVLYKKGPFLPEIRKILAPLGKRGCDVVLDHVGVETFNDSLKCLAWGGRWVTCGATSGSTVTLDLKPIFFKNISLLGSTMGSKGDFIKILRLIQGGKLKAVVDSVISMRDLPSAHARLESRAAFGKVVVTAEF